MRKRSYFTMTPVEQRAFRSALYRRLKSSWENDIIYKGETLSFNEYADRKAQQLEDAELYEELQALIDYFNED